MTNIEFFSLPAALNCPKMPKFLGMSRQLREVAETKISAGPSRVMGPAELIEMVQYITGVDKTRHIHTQAQRHKVTMCR